MMKKLLLMMGLCLLAVSAIAETSPQLDSIRIAAFNQLGIPIAGTDRMTAAKANAIINYGIQEVTTNFPAVEKLDTITLDSASEGGALASDFVAIKGCQLMSGDTMRIALEFKVEDSFLVVRPDPANNKTEPDDVGGGPYYRTHAGQLMVWPKFRRGDIGDTALFLISYYAVGDRLDAETDSTNIDEQFRDELLDWVCYRLEYLRYRYNSGDKFLGKYNKAKTEVGFKK